MYSNPRGGGGGLGLVGGPNPVTGPPMMGGNMGSGGGSFLNSIVEQQQIRAANH